MNLREYFENTAGIGVLATADGEGRVDAAIYARPHMLENGELGFVMHDRLTHRNLQTNPYATFLFVARGEGYQGVRLFLKKTREQADSELIEKLTRHCAGHGGSRGAKYLVLFQLEKILDLVGPGTPDLEL